MSTPHRLVVDPIQCDAHGLCAEVLPETVQLDDRGYPIVSREVVPRHLAPLARRAVSACAKLALMLVEAPVTAANGPGGRRRDT